MRIKDIIHESWVKPRPENEFDEISYQTDDENLPRFVRKELEHLNNIDNFKDALSGAKIEKYNQDKVQNVNNTDAADPDSFQSLDSDKKKRVIELFKKDSDIETPIILRNIKTGHEHLLAGNTRATYAMKKFGHFKATVIEY